MIVENLTLILMWVWPLAIIAAVYIFSEIEFRKKIKELNEEFYRESKRIDELENELLRNKIPQPYENKEEI